MQDRRDFFRSLIAGGATAAHHGRPGKYQRHDDELVYRGPMTIPANVAEIVRESPDLALSGSRPRHRVSDPTRGGSGGHLVSRYADSGVVWKFRCRIPESRQMVGDIRRAPAGLRICCWTAADPGSYDEPLVIAERKTARQAPPEISDENAAMAEYVDLPPRPRELIMPPLL